MSHELVSALSTYVARDRVESMLDPSRSLAEDGVALIADISGFTPLTEALTRGLSRDRGAEELAVVLDSVFTPLVEQIHAYQGSVLKFAGDALIVWYGRWPRQRRTAVIRRALTSAWRMQRLFQSYGPVQTPMGPVTLSMKIGMTYGVVKRYNLGLPEIGYEDVLAGRTLDRMAEAEHHAAPGEILLDAGTLSHLPGVVEISERAGGYVRLDRLLHPARRHPWTPLSWPHEESSELLGTMAAYVPRSIYETLRAGRDEVAELRPVVSLFVQFHGLDYDDDRSVADKVQTYFSTAQQVAERYGGRVNRLITGDKGSHLHLILGAPRSVEQQKARAVRCALDLQEECGGLPFITMQRIGMAAGRVFAGPTGSPVRHDYTTMGDSINLSARLMQHAAPDQILMDGSVRAQLGDDFEVADLGSITVKGKSDPIAVYSVLRHRQQRSRRSRRLTRLVGRDGEMALLRQRLSALESGEGGVITLVAEAGMGKTQLLAELHDEARMPWAEGECLAYGQTRSGYAFVVLLHDLMAVAPASDPGTATQRVLAFCADLFGADNLHATYPYLARFMGLPVRSEYAQRLEGQTGESIRWQLFEVIENLFRLLAAQSPQVLVLHDSHWADATTMEMVEALLPLMTQVPLLLVLSLRPEREHGAWRLRTRLLEQARPEHLDLVLGRLDAAAAATLLSQYAPQLPDPVVEYLAEKGAGNPLLLTELVRTLQAKGLFSDEVDPETLTVEALDLPDSVQGLLLAQIDRLPTEARFTLQVAAVIGQSFIGRVLGAVLGYGEQVASRLALLEANEFILRDDRSGLEAIYRFRHALIQESAYGTIPYQARRRHHYSVATAMERTFPGQIDEQAAFLGFHYERGGDLAQASTYQMEAADQLRLLYAHDEAVSLYHKVLELLAEYEAAGGPLDPERRARTYLKLAQVEGNRLDFVGAQRHYEQAFELMTRAQTSRPAVEKSATDHVIRLGVLHGPLALDPAFADIKDVSEIVEDLFEGLVELDAELNVIPAMAIRWHVDEGGRLYRFELGSELRWSDGMPLTAHDYVYAWRRNLDPNTGAARASELYVVLGAEAYHQGRSTDPASIGIEALDERTLSIRLASPVGYFPALLAQAIMFPQPAHIILAAGERWSRPENVVGNGAYRITHWESGNEIRLERNPYYWKNSAGNVDTAILRYVYPGLDQYLNDEVDWCKVEDQPDLPERYPNEASVLQYLYTAFIGFACTCPPFDQPLVRRAFALAVDQAELVEKVWGGVQRPALGGAVPPGMPGHSPEIGLPYDPAAGRELLRQAGYGSDGDFPTIKLVTGGPGFNETPYFLQQCWKRQLGVGVEVIDDLAIDEALDQLAGGAVHLLLFVFHADCPDPDPYLTTFKSTNPMNYFGWRDGQFDRMMALAAQESDQHKRISLCHEADRIFISESAGVIPLYYGRAYALMRPGFHIAGAEKILRGGVFRLKNIVAT